MIRRLVILLGLLTTGLCSCVSDGIDGDDKSPEAVRGPSSDIRHDDRGSERDSSRWIAFDSAIVSETAALSSKGLRQAQAHRLDSANASWALALSLSRSIGDSVDVADALYQQGFHYLRTGVLDSALFKFQDAIARLPDVPGPPIRTKVKCLNRIVVVYHMQNAYRDALLNAMVCDSLIKVHGAPQAERYILSANLGAVLGELGDHGGAYHQQLSTLSMFNEPGFAPPSNKDPRHLKAVLITNLGRTEHKLGRHVEAQAHLRRASALLDTLMNEQDPAVIQGAAASKVTTLATLSMVSEHLQDHRAALDQSKAALALVLAIDSDPGQRFEQYYNVANSCISWADASGGGAWAGACLAFIDSALVAGRLAPQDPRLARAYAVKALYYSETGDARLALQHSDSALRWLASNYIIGQATLPGPDEFVSLADAAHVLDGRGGMLDDLLRRTGDMKYAWMARDAYAAELACVGRMYTEGDLSARSGIADEFWTGFWGAIRVNMTLHQETKEHGLLDSVFAAMERSKDLMASRDMAGSLSAAPGPAARLVTDMLALQKVIHASERGSLSDEQAADYPAASIASTRERMQMKRDSLMRMWPAFHRLVFDLDAPTITEVQAALTDDRVLVESFTTRDHLYLLWIGRTKVFLQHLDMSTHDLSEELERFKDAVMSGTVDPMTAQGPMVLRRLFRSAVDSLAPRALVIVPDGPLWSLPFDALGAADEDRHPAERLFDGISLSFANSARDFLHAPKTDSAVSELVAFAPVEFIRTDGSSVDAGTNGFREAHGRAFVMSELPGSEQEVEETVGRNGGEVLLRKAATEKAFRAGVPPNAILHFATHAVVRSDVPDQSAIYFRAPLAQIPRSAHAGSSSADDILYAHEVYALDLPCEMVVLSACETAAGRYQRGAGIGSLARAFKDAGAKSLVASLWKVDDRATKEIMVKFYEKLAEGMGKADALAEAKRWYRKEYPNEPPSKWAAFILIGDNEPVRLKKRSPVRPWMWVSGGLVLLLAGTMVWRRTRRAAA